jgi:hypothetical protein
VTVRVDTVCWVFFALILAGVFTAGWTYHRGYLRGACVEMCRPVKFDVDQEVNGGCLCIGSDKVLRFKKIP